MTHCRWGHKQLVGCLLEAAEAGGGLETLQRVERGQGANGILLFYDEKNSSKT